MVYCGVTVGLVICRLYHIVKRHKERSLLQFRYHISNPRKKNQVNEMKLSQVIISYLDQTTIHGLRYIWPGSRVHLPNSNAYFLQTYI